MRLMASPLPEAREYGGMILSELQQVMPSFVSRVDRPERGGEWVSYLQERRSGTERWVERLRPGRREEADPAPSVELLQVEGSEVDLLAASVFEAAAVPEPEIRARVEALDEDERAQMLAAMIGE